MAEQQLSERNTRVAALEAECMSLRVAADSAEDRLRKRSQDAETLGRELQYSSDKITQLEGAVAELTLTLEDTKAQLLVSVGGREERIDLDLTFSFFVFLGANHTPARGGGEAELSAGRARRAICGLAGADLGIGPRSAAGTDRQCDAGLERSVATAEPAGAGGCAGRGSRSASEELRVVNTVTPTPVIPFPSQS